VAGGGLKAREIMTKCKRTDCPHEVVKDHPRANNKQFCSLECRDLHYKTVNADRLKAVRDRLNHRKYNQYEEGKTQCHICGGWYWAICHHMASRHQIDARTYKQMIGRDLGKGLIPERTKRIKRQHVFENGTVENLKKGAHQRYRKGDPRAGKYERSLETKERLKKQFKR
jgi:hypothetical protein